MHDGVNLGGNIPLACKEALSMAFSTAALQIFLNLEWDYIVVNPL